MTSRYQSFVEARDFLLQHRTAYQAAYSGFRWPRLDEFNWALDYFDVMARENDSPGLWLVDEDGGDERISFRELSERSNQVANWLRDLGVRAGDRILLMLSNERALWEAVLGSMKLRAVVVPASTLLVEADLQDRFDRGGVRHVIVSPGLEEKFARISGEYTKIVTGPAVEGWHAFSQSYSANRLFVPDGPTAADDPMLLYFTSGTTSKPKLVLHSHRSYPVGHLSTMYWIGLRRDDVHLNISSPGWAKHAWSSLFAPWNAGACVFVYNSARFNAQALLHVLETYPITTMCAPPTVWRMLIQADLKAARVKLRELVGAGEPLNPEVIDRVREAWGITIRDGFGQTETTCQIGNSPGQPIKAGSMGRPLPGYDVKLINPEGKVDQEGEVCLSLSPRPAGLMLGYASDQQRTDEVMREGHYHTGDVAEIDEDGFITFVGRSDDVFKSSDYRISPFELESVLVEHPAVVEAAVVPSPDPLRLYLPKAFVSLTSQTAPSAELAQDILEFCRQRLAPYKRIRRLEFSVLPKTISGKIRRSELRKQEEQRRASGERGSLEYFEEDHQAKA